MFLTYEYWYFISVLNKKTCSKIKKLISSTEFEDASVRNKLEVSTDSTKNGPSYEYTHVDTINNNVRITEIGWSSNQWLYDLVWPFMESANESAGWNFDIKAAEAMQIGKYTEGGFYNWHRDGESDSLNVYTDPDNTFINGRVRKLSMTVLLNENFEGGELQFNLYGDQQVIVSTPELNKAGSIIVFPSFTEHRITPVIKGTRYSLVSWFVGPPFK